MAKKLRTRKHKVVLNRSAGGDAGITFMLVVLGAFMFLPMIYAISQSLKPLDELFMFPPRFFVTKPTLDNYGDLFMLMNTSWVPFSRYIFNTVFISVVGTTGNLFFAAYDADGAVVGMTKVANVEVVAGATYKTPVTFAASAKASYVKAFYWVDGTFVPVIADIICD